MDEPTKTLVLHIEVPGIYADDLQDTVDQFVKDLGDDPADIIRDIVTDEWMRPEVGLTVVTRPGEKDLRDDFDVHAYQARIVGAHLNDKDGAS